jgi:hypothetical protein
MPIVIVALILLAVPAFSQLRLDLGLDVLKGLNLSSGDTTLGETISNWPSIPIPIPLSDVGLHYQFFLGPVNLGLGIRGFPLMLESMAWPNAFADLELGPVTIEAQVGAGLFAAFGLSNNLYFGRVLIPDLSAWFKFEATGAFRLGGGIIGLYVPDALGSSIPILVYLGGKVVLQL